MIDVRQPPYADIYDWLTLMFIWIPGWVGLYIVGPFLLIRRLIRDWRGRYNQPASVPPVVDVLRPLTWDACIKLGVVLLVVGFYFVLHVLQHFTPQAPQ